MKYKINGQVYDIPEDYLNKAMRSGLAKMQAVQMYLTDKGIIKNQEQEELHEKASAVKVEHGAKSDTKRATTPRKREPDMDKRDLVNLIKEALSASDKVKNIDISNVERMIDFTFNGNEYSFTLTKHRNK